MGVAGVGHVTFTVERGRHGEGTLHFYPRGDETVLPGGHPGGKRSRRREALTVRFLRELVQKSVPASQEAPVFEHLGARWVELPEVPLTRGPVFPGDFNKAIVETQVVTYRVLPGGPPLAIVGKLLDDEIADLTECQHLVWGLGYRHGDEGYVRVRRFHIVLAALGARD